MKEAEPFREGKTKFQLEQERLVDIRIFEVQEQLGSKKNSKRISRVRIEEANTFNAEEWDNIQSSMYKADEELAYELIRHDDMDTEKFDRDDLDKLWSLVKERFSLTDPTDDKERTLWVELKRLFEPDIDDILWKVIRKYEKNPDDKEDSRQEEELSIPAKSQVSTVS
ncbi:hypothetical protein Tco_1346431 [Tanacetum coccineum]